MKILKHKANGQEFLIVEVPEGLDVDDIQLIDSNELGIGYKNPDPDVDNWITKYIELPSGQYSIMFIAEYATEEQAAMVVDRVLYDLPPSPYNDFQGDWDSGYRDYECEEEAPNAEYPYVRKSTESMQSLIRANFTDQSKKHLILKKHS